VVFHVLAGTLIILDPQAGHSTGPDGVVRLIGKNEVAGGLMLASSLLALWYLRGGVSVVWLLPQQALLILAAANAIGAVMVEQYADGTPRASEFILTDQLPVILMAAFHLLVLFEFQWRRDLKEGVGRRRLLGRPARLSRQGSNQPGPDSAGGLGPERGLQ
jgi:hypothetical protein